MSDNEEFTEGLSEQSFKKVREQIDALREEDVIAPSDYCGDLEREHRKQRFIRAIEGLNRAINNKSIITAPTHVIAELEEIAADRKEAEKAYWAKINELQAAREGKELAEEEESKTFVDALGEKLARFDSQPEEDKKSKGVIGEPGAAGKAHLKSLKKERITTVQTYVEANGLPEERPEAPAHYQGYIQDRQWIDVMADLPTFRDKSKLAAALELQIRKYLDRLGQKDANHQELKKARFYLCYLIILAEYGKPLDATNLNGLLKTLDSQVYNIMWTTERRSK